MADDTVLYERRDPGIAILTLNRPERLNAWNGEMSVRYFELLDQAAADPDVKVIIVTGAGKGWCAGADMGTLQDLGDSAGSGGAEAAAGQREQYYTTTVPKPVIAAINGACAGLGMVQALMCDLRFAAKGAKFTTAFSRRGLIAEYGMSWILPRLVGTSRAMDLLFSGRVILAEEAAAMGLVNEVVEPEHLMDRTLEYAADPGMSGRGDLPPLPPGAGPERPATDAPSIFSALQEQLGLKLESTKGPVEVLVIDSAEKPTPD